LHLEIADMNKELDKKDPKPLQEKNRKPLYIGSIVLLGIILAFKFYFDYQDKKELEVFYKAELEAADIKLASISAELEDKIFEIDSLGGAVADLIAVKEDLEKERNQLQNTRKANREIITRLRGKTEGYEELLKAKDEEIEGLKAVNQKLLSENTNLKTEKNQLNRSMNQLSESKQVLEEKVAVASQLKIENMQVIAIAQNGREREGSFRSKQIGQIKVEFNISENKVAPIETKDIMIRIIDPNGQIVFDVAKGSGTFMMNGKEEFYTSLQTIVFDNSRQKLSFIYEKGSDYKPGQYTVEAITDGYQMGTGTFDVK
jgi:cell division protein ZapB